jgi:N-acetylglucosamine-6-phosphate deacetylase
MSNDRKLSPIPKGLADTKGYIDLQVNGYQDVNFSTPGLSVADIRRITQILLKRGTAAYCPTVVTSDLSVYEQNLPILAKAMMEPDLCDHLLGLHLEGPFISKPASGAHPQEHIRPPDVRLLDHWQSLSGNRVRIITLAPEAEGAEAFIRHATGQGIVCSLGHHVGDDASIKRAVDAGASLCTHLGNGIPNTLPRHPNPIWTQLADDRLTGMFITDGHHLPKSFIRVAIRAKGVSRFIVTSDVAPPGGMPLNTRPSAGPSFWTLPDVFTSRTGIRLRAHPRPWNSAWNGWIPWEYFPRRNLWKSGGTTRSGCSVIKFEAGTARRVVRKWIIR